MWRARLAVVVSAVLAAAAWPAGGAAGGGSSPSCALPGGGHAAGGGPLEWEPNRRLRIPVRGITGDPVALHGSTLVFSGVTRIGGLRRRGLAAVDILSRRVLPFDPAPPPGALPIAIALTPGVAYVAYRLEAEELSFPVQAYALPSGEPLPGFALADTWEGRVAGIAYAKGLLIVAGYSAPFGQGTSIAAYDPRTGAAVWRQDLGMTIVSMTGDGARLFVYPGGGRAISAIDAATGSIVPGWGAQLPAARARGEIFGVAGPRVLAWSGEFFGEGSVRGDLVVASRADGRPLRLAQLPNGGTPRYGTARTMVGLTRARGSRSSLRVGVYAVFNATGRLIGTACFGTRIVAQRDDRRVIALRNIGQTSAQLVELVRP